MIPFLSWRILSKLLLRDQKHQIKKTTLCKEVIQLLGAAAKHCRDDTLLSRLKIVFSKLDNAAEITDKSVEDLLFLPVDGGAGSNQRKRETNLDDLRRRYKAKSE